MLKMIYHTKFYEGLYCPLGKIVCYPKVDIEISDLTEEIPFRDLDCFLKGFVQATYECASRDIARAIRNKYNKPVKVRVYDSCLEAIFETKV